MRGGTATSSLCALGAGLLALAAHTACIDPCVLSAAPCDDDEDCQEGQICRLRRTFDLPCVFAAGTCEEGECGSVSRCSERECCAPETNTCVALEDYAGPCDDRTCRDCSQTCGAGNCTAPQDGAPGLDARGDDSGLPDARAVDASGDDAELADRSRTDTGRADSSRPDTRQLDVSQPDTRLPDARQPDSTQPDSSLPDSRRPDTSQPDTSLPDTSLPDTWRPDISTIDASDPPGSCQGSATTCPQLGGSEEGCAGQAGCWPELACVGLPPADCGVFGDAQACTDAGCSWDGDCADTARPCYSLSGDLCPRQVGCSWNYTEVRCEGTAAACSSFDELSPCVSQIDCWWYPGCEGSPPLCDSFLSEPSCQTAPYCGWEIVQCSGSVHACSAIDTYPACLSQLGCDWR